MNIRTWRRIKTRIFIAAITIMCVIFLKLTFSNNLLIVGYYSAPTFRERLSPKDYFDYDESDLTRIDKMQLAARNFTKSYTGSGVEMKLKGDYSDVKLPPFIDYGLKWSPGEQGRPYFIRGRMRADKQRQRSIDFHLHYFDEWVSREIAVHRRLDDVRSMECQKEKYSHLPSASVVIVFHNEAWTTLLRTIHSILNRTPPLYLKEIILVDDFSTMGHLKLPLEKYLQPIAKLRLIRATRRLGLILARNLGYTYTKAEVVIFFDSHVECYPGWYEPLVAPIKDNPTTVTFPVIDVIDHRTFGIAQQMDSPVVGGVDIRTLTFTWLIRDGDSKALVRRSPAMPGGLYAISKRWFAALGMYDPQMNYWGGENIELSFKIWMCGGAILISKCSHVAHVFRHQTPIQYDRSATQLNSVRAADVWMDEYRHFFYEKMAYFFVNKTDVRERIKFRKSLRCHNFAWYLDNVHRELLDSIDEGSVYTGQLQNTETNLCLQAGYLTQLPSLAPCALKNYAQIWMLRTDGHLVCYESVLEVKHAGKNNETKGPALTIRRKINSLEPFSDDGQKWTYDTSTQLLTHMGMGLCLEVQYTNDITTVGMASCTDKPTMKWRFQTRQEMQNVYGQLLKQT